MSAPFRDPSVRFWAKVEKSRGCFRWTGALNNCGYGVFGAGGRHNLVLAHRWAFEQERGPIPAGLTLDHLCCVRNCVNPAHLEPVTEAENRRRAYEKRGGVVAVMTDLRKARTRKLAGGAR